MNTIFLAIMLLQANGADEYVEQARLPVRLEKEQDRLRNAEIRHQLKEKEAALIKKGILPPHGVPSMAIEGKHYDSWLAFKDTNHYKLWKYRLEKERQNEKLVALYMETRRKSAVFNSMLADPVLYERYLKIKIRKESEQIFLKIEHEKNLPFAEWPDHWKRDWAKWVDEQRKAGNPTYKLKKSK